MWTRFQKDEAAESTLVSTGHLGAPDSMTTLTLQSVRRALQIRDALRYRDDTNLRCPSPITQLLTISPCERALD